MTCLLAMHGEEVGAMAVCGAALVVALGIVMGTVRRTAETRQREQSRREIAAYVAEGAMSPEEGERLLNAGRKSRPA